MRTNLTAVTLCSAWKSFQVWEHWQQLLNLLAATVSNSGNVQSGQKGRGLHVRPSTRVCVVFSNVIPAWLQHLLVECGAYR